jgi:hypothetical protein
MLPRLPNADKIRKAQTIPFSGINRNPAAVDGTLFNTTNMDTERWPLLAPRKKRKVIEIGTRFRGMIPYNGLIYVNTTYVFWNGNRVGYFIDTDEQRYGMKQLAVMNGWVLIFPNKQMLDLSRQNVRATPMEVHLRDLEIYFEDQIVDEDYTITGNTIRAPGMDWAANGLKVGDGVQITGASEPKNNQTIIIRGIDGDKLRFYRDSFVTGTDSISIHRSIPDMDRIFVHENRLWGYKDTTVYCSKLGDPTNFNVYDVLDDDSWATQIPGENGRITGAISYQGYPTFFKENEVYRIYGDSPSQYRTMLCGHTGVLDGCADSLAIAGEILYYLSPEGMAAFRGGYPSNVHTPFGEIKFDKCIAAGDGTRYIMNAHERGTGNWGLWVYDTKWDAWFRHDGDQYAAIAGYNGFYFMQNSPVGTGSAKLLLEGRGVVPSWVKAPFPYDEYVINPDEDLMSEAVWNDFTGNYWTGGRGYGNPSRKGTSKIQLRVWVEAGKTLKVSISYDGGTYQTVKEITGDGRKESYYLPIIPHRSDHYRLAIQCNGDWTLYSLVREEYSGSDIH